MTWKGGGLWCARIGINGKKVQLGYFKDEKQAAAAYLEAHRREA